MGLFLPRAVVFDWDMTLVDSADMLGCAINLTRTHYGLAAFSREDVLAATSRSARENFPLWFGNQADEAMAFFYERFADIRKNGPPKAMEGAPELLEWFKDGGFPMLVVSNKRHPSLLQDVADLGWAGYFVSVVGAFEAAKDKPAREHLDLALQRAGIGGGSDILFIGDGVSDVLCAHNAGCSAMMIGTEAKAQACNADFSSPDLPQALRRFKGVGRQ